MSLFTLKPALGRAAGSALPAFGSNQAGIDSKGRSINQPLGHAAPAHGLEQLSQQIAVTEAAMPFLEKVEWSGTSPSRRSRQNQR